MQRHPRRLTVQVDESSGLEDSFAVENGQFIRGGVEISSSGMAILNREYTGLNGRDFQVVRQLGAGASGCVNLVQHSSGKMMALKVINVHEKHKRQQIMEEIKALYNAKCDCLVGFYGAFYLDGSISIALEYMDEGCLDSVLHNYGRIPEKALAGITFQCLWGLAYLQHEKRVHRDIKPQNILCNSAGEVKLTDFGISKELENSIGLCQTFVGTFKYMSPERITSRPYSYPSDIWSLGMCILECSIGCYPFQESQAVIDMVQTILESPPPTAGPGASREFVEFIDCCLRRLPESRLPADVLLHSRFFSENIPRDHHVNGDSAVVLKQLLNSSKEVVHLWLGHARRAQSTHSEQLTRFQ